MTAPPLFDCNVHPTIDGRWSDGRPICNFSSLAGKLQESGFAGAAAVGLPGTGSYDDTAFIACCRDWHWVPVAGWRAPAVDDYRAEVNRLAQLGYRAIKVHPRSLGEFPSAIQMGNLLAHAAHADLPVLLCTYPFLPARSYAYVDVLAFVHESLRHAPDAKVMLMHAGAVELLRYMEFARINRNVTLDLSFTLLKYRGSSLDQDLAFAFRRFDQRIVIGSDYPEFDFASVRERYFDLSHGLSEEQKVNIAWRNAYAFFGLSGAPTIGEWK